MSKEPTQQGGEIDQELLPERSDFEDLFWYVAGGGATAFLTGIMGMFGQAPQFSTMALTGAVILVGAIVRQVMK